jgi:hypothetical protein
MGPELACALSPHHITPEHLSTLARSAHFDFHHFFVRRRSQPPSERKAPLRSI